MRRLDGGRSWVWAVVWGLTTGAAGRCACSAGPGGGRRVDGWADCNEPMDDHGDGVQGEVSTLTSDSKSSKHRL